MKWNVDSIVWDFDGVVADTGKDIAKAANWTLQQLGLPEQPNATLVRYIGGGAGPLVRKMLGERADELYDRALPLMKERYGQYFFVETDLYPGIREVLEFYARAGKSMGIATNKVETVLRTILRGLELEPFFEVLIGPESVTRRKPDPEVVLKVLETLGTAPKRAVMIGDTAADIGAGKAAGTWTVGVTYGYGSREEVEGAGPDVVIDSALELLEYVE